MADYFTNFSLVLKLANETEQVYALDLAHKAGLDALDFDNNGQAIWKTPRNAPQPTDLLFRCLILPPCPENTAWACL